MCMCVASVCIAYARTYIWMCKWRQKRDVGNLPLILLLFEAGSLTEAAAWHLSSGLAVQGSSRTCTSPPFQGWVTCAGGPCLASDMGAGDLNSSLLLSQYTLQPTEPSPQICFLYTLLQKNAAEVHWPGPILHWILIQLVLRSNCIHTVMLHIYTHIYGGCVDTCIHYMYTYYTPTQCLYVIYVYIRSRSDWVIQWAWGLFQDDKIF